MNMILTQASPSDVARKIKENINWLTLEKLEYILKNRKEILSCLNVSDFNPNMLKDLLSNKHILLIFAQQVTGSDWSHIISEMISKPLTKSIFDNDGILLKFLDKKEYEPIIKDFLNNVTAFHNIPKILQSYLNEKEYEPITKKIINNIVVGNNIPSDFQKYLTEDNIVKHLTKNKKNNLSFSMLSDEVKTKKVYTLFMNQNEFISENLYENLNPKSHQQEQLKNDMNIAYMLCKNNKQFYKKLSPTAQCYEDVIGHVINKISYSGNDGVADSIDNTAILTKELPLDAVKSINNIYLIKQVFYKNPQFYTHPELQKKWFTNEENKIQLAEYLNYFPKKTDEDLKKELRNKDIYTQVSMIQDNPKLINIIIDKKDVDHCLEILYCYQGDKGFEKPMDRLGLKDVVRNNVDKLINVYMENNTGNGGNSTDESKSLKLGIWLFNQNKEEYTLAACKLLSKVVNKTPNIFKLDLDYLYQIKNNTLQDNSFKVYEYIDENKEPFKKHKM